MNDVTAPPPDPFGSVRLPVGKLRRLAGLVEGQHRRPAHRRPSPYQGPARDRMLRVVWDEGAVADDAREVVDALLLSDRSIEVWRYADGGPPSDATRDLRIGRVRMEVADGWLLFEPAAESNGFVVGQVTTVRDGGCTTSGVFGNAMDVAEAEEELGGNPADRRAAALCLFAAEAAGADLLVTTRDLLLQRPKWMLGDYPVLSRSEARAFIDLFLRQVGVYLPVTADPGAGMTPQAFLRTGAAGLAPRLGCLASDSSTLPDSAERELADRILRSVARALQDRDQLHAALLAPQDFELGEAAILSFEHALTNLMSAFDALARLVHLRVVASTSPVHPAEIAFQKRWLGEHVNPVAPKIGLSSFFRGSVRLLFGVGGPGSSRLGRGGRGR